MDENRRKTKRLEWNRPGRILLLVGSDTVNCFVKNISPNGARLMFPVPEIVPDYFRLDYGAGDIAPRCRVRWRKGNEVGVEFVQGA